MENSSLLTDKILLRLSPNDNVFVLIKSMPAGATFRLRGQVFHMEKSLGLGHKIAVRHIRPGEKIYKYGAPIGSATRDIQPGEHVHVHNMKSDYLPNFRRDEGR
jgi:hypothetical protein